ncbi:BspA family leucine-rich repeat surface protein [Mesonia phycicola]|uniref:BspA family leucine-rich repeat surface protein n=1 Tax=Mesonia phycicola TaxID=579105 RepID=UPI00093324FF|nr:BspA family leucine-rich repeat surface protein [Mesonia phycicola]
MKSFYALIFLLFTSITCFSQNAPFITTWEVDASDLSITIPTSGTGYNYTINFGDGTVLNNQNGNVTHTYVNAGTYTVSIAGDFPRIQFGFFNSTDINKIKSIEQWGDIEWHTMYYAFQGCSNLKVNAIDAPDLSLVTNMSGMFRDCSSFNESIDHWDVSNVIYMRGLFGGAISFNQPLNSWDVSNVIYIEGMFEGATSFNQPLDNWDVSNVKYMGRMFYQATTFNQLLNSWDVSNVVTMRYMFRNANSYNQSLNNWDVSNVTNMSGLFRNAISFNQSLNNWDVSNVTDMHEMFREATSFNQPLNNWDVSSVINMSGVFRNAINFNQSLNNWDVSNVEYMGRYYGPNEALGYGGGMFEGATSFNQPLNTWNVSNVEDMGFMFSGATSFNQPLNNWNVSSVEYLGAMFDDASAFNQDLSSWSFNQNVTFNNIVLVSNIQNYSFVSGTNIDVQNYDLLLGQFSSLGLTNKTLDSLGLAYCDFNTRSNLINNLGWTITGDNLDANCTNGFITTWEVDASDLSITIPTSGTGYNYTINFGDGTVLNNQTGNATHTYTNAGTYTVSIAGDFPRIQFGDSNSTDNDKIKSIENWGDIAWQSMRYAFSNCSNLVINAQDAPDLSLVEDMSYMFMGCSSFNQSINHWEVSNVELMTGTFQDAIVFNQDLSSWSFHSNIVFEDSQNITTTGFLNNTDLDIQNYDLLLAQFSSLGLTNKYLGALSLEYCDFNARFNLENGLGWSIAGDSLNTNCAKPFITTWEVDTNNPSITIPTLGTGYNYTVNFGDGTWLSNQTGDVSHTYVSPGTYTVAISGDFPRIRFTSTAINYENLIKSIEQWGDIEWQSMENAFTHCNNLIVNAQDAPDLSLVENMSAMFANCSSFNQNINHWDVSNVVNMSGLFSGATSFNQPLHNWDISNVTNLSDLFSGASSFNQPLNSWDVSNVTNMGGIFVGTTSFNQPLDSWDVSNVTTMGAMFVNSSFNQDIGNWDVSNVVEFGGMFSDAASFNQDISSWYFRSDVLNFGDFLYDAGLDVENYDKLLKRFHELNLIGKNLNSNGLFYCESNPERNELINNLGWTIYGDQLDSNCTLSNDNYAENNLVVYPNPTQGKLFVEAEVKLKHIEVFTVLGQKINLSFSQQTKTGQELQADLSFLENGVYFLKIYTDDGYQIERIVKNL